MKTFYLNGEIVGRQSEKQTPEDVCPDDFRAFTSTVQDGEEIEIAINSYGGDVLAALNICSLIGDLQQRGHSVTAVIQSIAASSASVIACKCDSVRLYAGAYLMIHLPWTSIPCGNALDLQKEIQTLEMMTNSMLRIYKTKFACTEQEIVEALEAETWICEDNAAEYGLDVDIVINRHAAKIAAKITPGRFLNMPKALKMEKEEKLEIEKLEQQTDENPVENSETVTDENPENETVENPVEETTEENPEENPEEESEAQAEENPEGPTVEELQERIRELEEIIEQYKRLEEAPVEDRVRGMQKKMQARINDQERIFKSQIDEATQKLEAAQTESTSLRQQLDEVSRELSAKASALEKSEHARASMHAGVLAAPEPSADWRTLKGPAFWDFLRKHPEVTR